MNMKYLVDNIEIYTDCDFKSFEKIIKPQKLNLISKKEGQKQKESLLGEILLIKLLNDIKIFYKDISIIYNKNGKPYILNNPIFFNISHKDGIVVCIINNTEIGIDIETINNKNMEILNFIATDSEKIYVGNSLKRLTKLFTLKEAYFKAYGKDMLSPKDVQFKFYKNKIMCSDNTVYCKSIYKENYFISIIKKIVI